MVPVDYNLTISNPPWSQRRGSFWGYRSSLKYQPAFLASFIGFKFVSGPNSRTASLPLRSAPPLLTSRNSASPFPQTSEPSIGESRGPRCPKSGYNSIWAARLLFMWAGHLELLTAGSSTNHEQCWTVQEKVENILHAKATLTPLWIHIKRAYLINQCHEAS